MDIFKSLWALFVILIFTVLSAVVVGGLFSEPYGNVALININGEISIGNGFFSSGAESDKIVSEIKDANSNPYIKALLVEINSPGGSVVATKEIASALKNVNKTKVCWLREIAASGAYWIASACDYIVADNFTITGSIGVSGSYLEFSGLFEKYGVNYVRLVSGKEKDIGTPYRQPTQDELNKIQSILDEIHAAFVKEIAENRNLSVEYISKIADGSIFTGEEAKKLGLVDVIGGKEDAISIIKEKANLTEVEIVEPKEEVNFLDVVSGLLSKEIFNYMLSNQFKLSVEYS
ncbi:MAG: signal peptide peptidase SppA [Nanoarchaeota archaeon]|nr:signal peptide peptidase SppA [Nanoarchaeota archaeon]